MIKAIITDVDGVVIGTKAGGHFPNPSPRVTGYLRDLGKKLPIVLCSGKPSFGLEGLIRDLELDNLHIATNGAVIFNPIRSEYRSNSIPSSTAKSLIESLEESEISKSIVGEKTFFHEKGKVIPFVEKLSQARHMSPTLVADFSDVINRENVIRIDAYIAEDQKHEIEEIIQNYSDELEVNFTSVQFDETWIALITKKGISKESTIKQIAGILGLSLDDVLGIGDSMNDWTFIRNCGYQGVMGNSDERLKQKAKDAGKNHFIGGHVDEDGMIEIIDYYISV